MGGDDLIGVARRLPDTTATPYRAASWCARDLSEPGSERELAVLLEGADAVIHLAWAISPERGEPPMWRTNDHGTRHVLDAVAAAAVPHVVVLSSVAEYVPAPSSYSTTARSVTRPSGICRPTAHDVLVSSDRARSGPLAV
ncbi:hypothetical protein GCM10027598_59060 [Amycolatopsis oliviviridis]|uniref:NAD-dependent epimerase/dehydratase domain-containing protein n=1 Tax=Amycolatopsis oliviviridis TaxID=1471590 RepID=A0ABQ3M065_9PSEU|nr:NAD-dependent epimerase/dehydratase family protein [Amycolatopsis oliviviridis]GHH28607.1 hypothetical protein GCM10017790_59710 [Amycolatopsis oliviviridis]